MGLKKSISFYFLLILFLSCNKPDQTYSYSGFALGTNFNILYNSDKPLKNLNKLTDSIFFDLNKSLSTYIPSSDISKINNGDNSIIVDENFKKVFNASKIIWEESGGYFDPTIGLLTNAYGLGPNTNPNYSINVDSLLNFTGFEKVNLTDNKINLQKGMFLDFNAIAKGYGVDLISNLLKANGIDDFLIDIGGEMYASGINSVSKTSWRVGISDPINPEKSKQKIFIKDKGLASSGNYRKFLINPISGDKIVHTINPLNGSARETNVLAASVIAKDCMTA
jgi:thiamine biosynthesis lipoprotein